MMMITVVTMMRMMMTRVVVAMMMMMITYHQGDIRPKGELRLSVGGRNRGNWRPDQ